MQLVSKLSEKNLQEYVGRFRQNKPSEIRMQLQKVQGLKMYVMCPEYSIQTIVYFCELKIPRIEGVDAKTSWGEVEKFVKESLKKDMFILKFIKQDVYKGEVSLYGDVIFQGKNLRQELLKAGLTELASNAKDFLEKESYEKAYEYYNQAKREERGLFGMKTKKPFKNRQKEFVQEINEKPERKSSTQLNRWKQYEMWIKEERRVSHLSQKNPPQQIIEILNLLNWDRKQELSDNKLKRLRILSQVFATLMLNKSSKYLPQFKQYVKSSCILVNSLSEFLLKKQSIELLKVINILLRGLVFCLNEIKENIAYKKDQFYQSEFDKVIRNIFKLIFIGNSVLHMKVFGKIKDLQLDNFDFNAVDYSGISSLSEVSESEDTYRPPKENNIRKVQQTQLKVRISASLCLSLIFKNIPNLLQIHSEMCVKSAAFSEQFNEHIRQLAIQYEGHNLSQTERASILNMMRINFGELSLLCMLIFQENPKVKLNILECMHSMMVGFQGRKILSSLDTNLLQKQQKKALSFLPKSLMIFWTYKNILYTLLFCLRHEKNIEVVIKNLHVLTMLTEHTALLSKMPYEQGAGLLLRNFILPILKFPAENQDVCNLQLAAIGILTAIVSQDYNWKELNQWLLNINQLIISIVKNKQSKKNQSEIEISIIDNINIYVGKLTINHLDCLVKNNLFHELSEIFKNSQCSSFSKVIEQLCRKLLKQNDDEEDASIKEELTPESEEVNKFSQHYLNIFLSEWLAKHQTFNNPQDLIDVLDIMTCLNNNILTTENYKRVTKFMLFCFDSLSDEVQGNHDFEPMAKKEQFKANILVRVSYVKLIGHMSFCTIFHKEQVMKKAYSNLISILRTSKGVNTIIKCSWALSNWCNVEAFLKVLTVEQLKQTFQFLMDFSQSQKEKISSNGLRGIGMFIKNLDKSLVESVIIFNEVEKIMTSNINNKSPKVSWNCSAALRNILLSPNSEISLKLLKDSHFIESLLHNFSRSNFKLQIQTLETLKHIDSEELPNYAKQILKRVTEILQETLRHLTEYSFNEFKYIDTLRKELIAYYVDMTGSLEDKDIIELCQNNAVLFIESLYQLLNGKASTSYDKNVLLEKGSQASLEAQSQIFNVKPTTQNQDHDEMLIPVKQSQYNRIKIMADAKEIVFFTNLKKSAQRISSILQNSQEKVSLRIIDAFQQLAKMDVMERQIEVNLIQL